MTIPPIAVESAKEALHRLLELCMSDTPPLDKDVVRSHVLDGIEALTDDRPTLTELLADADPSPIVQGLILHGNHDLARDVLLLDKGTS